MQLNVESSSGQLLSTPKHTSGLQVLEKEIPFMGLTAEGVHWQ